MPKNGTSTGDLAVVQFAFTQITRSAVSEWRCVVLIVKVIYGTGVHHWYIGGAKKSAVRHNLHTSYHYHEEQGVKVEGPLCIDRVFTQRG